MFTNVFSACTVRSTCTWVQAGKYQVLSLTYCTVMYLQQTVWFSAKDHTLYPVLPQSPPKYNNIIIGNMHIIINYGIRICEVGGCAFLIFCSIYFCTKIFHNNYYEKIFCAKTHQTLLNVC